MDDLTPMIGHNSGLPYDPEITDRLEARVRDLADAGGEWLALGAVADDGQASRLNDFLTQVRTCEREIEAERKTAKAPHEAAGKAVDAKFKVLAGPLGKLTEGLKGLLGAFAEAKRARLAEEQERARRAALAAQEEADRLRREAEARNDVIGQAAAEEAAKEAARAAKTAEKPVRVQIASATGGGRTMAPRTAHRAQIDNKNRAFGFFRDHELYAVKVEDLLIQLAEAEHRRAGGAKNIPGVTFTEIRSIA